MPAKKIDLAEKIQREKRLAVKRKVLFALVLIGLIGIANAYAHTRPQPSSTPTAQSAPSSTEIDVLGKVTEREVQSLSEVVEQSQGIVEDVSQQTDEVISHTKEHLTQKIDEAIYVSTIKPIIDKIESLPSTQQEYIQEAVCKP